MRRAARRAKVLVAAGMSAAMLPAACFDFGVLSGSDTSPDSSTTDSAALPDRFTDDGAAIDAGLDATFCARNPGHTFCDDFDQDNYPAEWNHGSFVTDGGQIARDGTLFNSPPYGLLASVTASPTFGAKAQLENDFVPVPSDMTISFWLRITTAGSSGLTVATLNLQNGYAFVLLLKNGPILIAQEQALTPDGGTQYPAVPNIQFALTTNVWVQVTEHVELGGTNQVTVDVSGAPPLSGALPVAPPTIDATRMRLYFGAGAYSSPPFDAWGVSLDDVLLDLK